MRTEEVEKKIVPGGNGNSADSADSGDFGTGRKAAENRKKKKINWYVISMVYYILCVLIYYSVVAKDRYVSRAQFVVTRGQEAGQTGSLQTMLGAGQSQQDAHTAIAYIYSVDMMKWLEEEGFDMRDHYSKAGQDLFFRLDSDASEQDVFDYFRERVEASFDDVKGIVTMEVEAFDADFAYRMAEAIVRRSEQYLNDTNRAIASERMNFIVEELEESELKLEQARQDLLEFQNQNLNIDPLEDVRSRLELIQEMKKQKVMLNAQVIELKDRSPQSPAISEAIAQIKALEQEIERESGTLTGEAPDQMNQLMSGYTKLNQALEFATMRHSQSLNVVEEIRIQTLQQHRFLSVIEKPFKPEEAIRPWRIYMSITFVMVGLLVVQLVALLLRTIKEHQQ